MWVGLHARFHSDPKNIPAEPQILPGLSALREFRSSVGGADYFITCCLERPDTGLSSPEIGALVLEKMTELENREFWRARTCVIMPDYLHLLITLNPERSLSEVMRLFKGPLTVPLRAEQMRWQTNYYDHRIRGAEELLPTFFYIFLNPYRAGLIKVGERWPWYHCDPDDWKWFGALTNKAHPFPERLQ